MEDEHHVLLQCSSFTDIRRDLFDHVRKSYPRFDSLSDENKFIYLLNSSSTTIKDVARFFHSAYKAHLTHLNRQYLYIILIFPFSSYC